MSEKFPEAKLEAVVANFEIGGESYRFSPLGHGHINDTYLVEAKKAKKVGKYTLQRINTYVFRQPELMMANWEKITCLVRKKMLELKGKEGERQSLRLVPTRLGLSFYRSPEGEYWRAYHYVDGCHTIDIATTAEQAFEAGQTFGLFQRLIADLPPEEVHETIPFFHHTPHRFQRFLEGLKMASPERKDKAAAAISFALERQSIIGLVTDGLSSSALPLRVTHNDTKINNVLFDDKSGKGICVIDLDTTMPGSPLYDFGDLVRTATCPAAEDETDLSLIAMDINLFRAVVEGYLAETAAILTPLERELLVWAGPLITFTIGLRFLTDYLEGDIYFKISRPEHNLDRARAQFKLLSSMEEQKEDMEKSILSALTLF